LIVHLPEGQKTCNQGNRAQFYAFSAFQRLKV
jgi:hypothetical protein